MTDQERKAMEMALEALEDSMYPQKKQFDAIVGLKQALAQEEQEPINKMPTKIFGPNLEQILNNAGFYRLSEQKPKAWIYDGNLHIFDPTDWALEPESVQPLYTAPPSKPWVSLTDEEIAYAVGSPIDEVYLNDFRKVEAALRSKNNG